MPRFHRTLMHWSLAAVVAALLTLANPAAAWAAGREPAQRGPATLGATVAGSGCRDAGRYTVCTTIPVGGAADETIAREMRRLIMQTTGDGDSIRLTMYFWELLDGDTEGPELVANALVDRRRAGVDIQIVLGDVTDQGGGCAPSDPNCGCQPSDPLCCGPSDPSCDPSRAAVAAGPDRSRAFKNLMARNGIPVKVCLDSCMDPIADPDDRRGTMHNKFFLIQHGNSRTVVLGSSNLSQGQLEKAEHLVVVRDDVRLFDYLGWYWDRLTAGTWAGWHDADKEWAGTFDYSRAYVFYRYGGDPVLNELNNITECQPGNDTVWLSVSFAGGKKSGDDFLPTVRDAVRDRLITLANVYHCDVRVSVVTDTQEQWAQQPNRDGGRLNPDRVRVTRQETHDKYMLVNARYNGQWRQVVFHGSHNLLDGGSSLRYTDDVMLRVAHPGVFEAFDEYFLATRGPAR